MKKSLIILILSVLILTTSCGDNSTTTTSNQPETITSSTVTTSSEAVATEAPAVEREDKYGILKAMNDVKITDDSVIVTDLTGVEKTIPRGKKRIVTLYGSYTNLMYSTGGADNLVGRISTKRGDSATPKAITENEDITIVAKSSSGKKISVEAVLATNPDLVIIGSAMSQPALEKPIASAGVDTLVLDYEHFSDYFKWFKVLAAINNRTDLIEDLAMPVYDESIKYIDMAQEKSVDNKQNALAMLITSKNMRAYLSNGYVGSMLKMMGTENSIEESLEDAPTGTSAIINMESLAKADPDVILLRIFNTKGFDELMAEYDANPIWQNLSAVKNGRVHVLDPDLFLYRPHEKFPEAFKTLYEYLYGE